MLGDIPASRQVWGLPHCIHHPVAAPGSTSSSQSFPCYKCKGQSLALPHHALSAEREAFKDVFTKDDETRVREINEE